jgi:hypothetical protein
MAAGKPNKSHHKKPHLHHETWKELFEDDEHGGLLIPILALAYEHDLDPEMRPCKDAIDPAHR